MSEFDESFIEGFQFNDTLFDEIYNDSKNSKNNKNIKQNKIYIYNVNLPIIPLKDTVEYIYDLLGLRTLDETGRLHILETNCTHQGHKTQECFPQLEKLTFPFL